MYSNNLFVVLCFVGVVSAYHSNKDLRIIDSIQNESPCLSNGGICTIAADCPKGKLAEPRGLCPEQRSGGVECCYGVSVKETRCQNLGGDCLEGCTQPFLIPKATDCPEDTICCLLI